MRLGNLLKAAISLFGFGTVLYGCGHLILAGHYGFWGLPGRVLWSSAEASEAGGRFLLLDVPLTLLGPILGLHPAFLILVVLLALTLLASRKYGVLKRSTDIASALRAWALEYGELIVVVTLLLSAVIVNPVWKAMEFSCAFRPTRCELPANSQAIYDGVAWRSVIAFALAYVSTRLVLQRPASLLRALVILEWLVVSTAVFTWPVAFGKFRFRPSYPSVTLTHDDQASVLTRATSDVLLLVGSYDKDLVLWNRTQHRLELQPAPDKPMILGPKLDFDLKPLGEPQ